MLENGKYTETIHAMTAPEIWAAWKNLQLNMGQVATWQQIHNIFMDENGRILK